MRVANEITAGHPAAKRAWREIGLGAGRRRSSALWRGSRIGFLGHTYPGCLTCTATTRRSRADWARTSNSGDGRLEACVNAVMDAEIKQKQEEAFSIFDVSDG